MRKSLVAAIFAAGVATFAPSLGAAQYENDTMVAKQGNDVIRLWETACVHAGTLALIKPEWREKFKKARALIDGYDFYACWMREEDSVVVVYEDGDVSRIPLSMFNMDRGA